MPPTGILVLHLVLLVFGATAAPRTKDHEWKSAERSVRSENLDQEIRTALEAALEGPQEEEEDVVLVTEKPVFVKEDVDDQIQPEVKPQDDNYVVPSYSPVGSENEFGSEDTNKLTPSLILGIEKQLQDEMGQMEGQLSLLHTLVSSIFGQQATLNPKEDFDPNVVVVNIPQQQGSVGDHNPFNFGFDPFLNDNNDDATDDNYDDAWSWFQDRPKFPSLSDVFGFPDSNSNNTFGFPEFGDIDLSKNDTDFDLPSFFGELPNKWSNLPNNYSNSTHEIQHVNGSVIDVNEAINKQSGDGYNFFSHKQIINVRPEDIEIPIDTKQEQTKDTEEQIEDADEAEEAEETEEAEEVEQVEEAEDENEEVANKVTDFENIEEITQNENQIEGRKEEVQLVEKEIENELSEFPEFKMEADNSIEDEEALIHNWRSQEPEEFSLDDSVDEEKFSLGETLDEGEFPMEESLDEGEFSLGETIDEGEFSLGDTLDEGLSMNHEPLLLPSDQLVLPEEAVFGRQYENEVHDHELVDFVSDQLSMPDKSAYYDIRSLENGNKNSVLNYESTYRDLSDDTRINRISANKSGMRMIEPNAEIFDYKRVLEESKPIQ